MENCARHVHRTSPDRPLSRRTFAAAAFLLAPLAVLLGACTEAGEQVLEVRSEGFVEGVVFHDVNGNLVLDGSDEPAPDVRVRVVAAGTTQAVSTVRSDGNGIFRHNRVPVGTYDLRIDGSTVPDSLGVVLIQPSRFQVLPNDTVFPVVALSFPALSVPEGRAAATGSRVFVTGIVLNRWDTFGVGTVHLRGGGAAIRATNVLRDNSLAVGDSVRFLGTVRLDRGQPTLHDVTSYRVGISNVPLPIDVGTGAAAGASGGTLDADLVRVVTVTVTDTATVDDGYFGRVSDGSGSLGVFLDLNVGFNANDLRNYAPGAVLDITGLLTPSPDAAEWWLLPRARGDIRVRTGPPPPP